MALGETKYISRFQEDLKTFPCFIPFCEMVAFDSYAIKNNKSKRSCLKNCIISKEKISKLRLL